MYNIPAFTFFTVFVILMYMWSSRVALMYVVLSGNIEGKGMVGRKVVLVMSSKNCWYFVFVLIFRKSMLKSPARIRLFSMGI